MTAGGIYAITHAATGRRYVGSAVNVSKRWHNHKSDLRLGRHANAKLQNGWNKHSAEAFTFSLVEAVADVADLAPREQWHMDSGDFFYNIRRRAESNLGLKFSDATRAKISAAKMGKKHSDERRAKNSDAQKGRKLSDETRQRISAAKKGHKHSPERIAASVAGMAAARAKRESA